MNTFKFAAIVLAVGFATAIGCGSDSDNSSPDAKVIVPGTGGAAHLDAGAGGAGGTLGPDAGAGGAIVVDAPIAGSSGGLDGGALDTSLVVIDATQSEARPVDTLAGEVAGTTTICTGLSAAACDLAIRNDPVAATVVTQTVSDVPLPPNYLTCNQ